MGLGDAEEPTATAGGRRLYPPGALTPPRSGHATAPGRHDHNVSGTQTVLSAAASSRRLKRLVFVSSASVYGYGNPDDW